MLEARDLWLSLDNVDSNSAKAHKKVYRAIFHFEKKSWLRSEGSGRKKRYFQAEQFKELHNNVTTNNQADIKAKERAALLLDKVNVLTKIINKKI